MRASSLVSPSSDLRWDLRDASGGGSKPKISFTGGHAGDVMSLSFSPYQEYLLLTASVDK